MKLNKLDNKKDFETLFKELNVEIYRYIYTRCGYSREKAEDLTQEVFLKAWTKKDSFDSDKSSLKNWVYVITRNHLIDSYRKKNFEKNITDEKWEQISEEFGRKIDNQIMVETILKSLDELKKEEKDLLILRYVQDLYIREICEITGKSNSAIKVNLHRSIKKLRKIIEENERKRINKKS